MLHKAPRKDMHEVFKESNKELLRKTTIKVADSVVVKICFENSWGSTHVQNTGSSDMTREVWYVYTTTHNPRNNRKRTNWYTLCSKVFIQLGKGILFQYKGTNDVFPFILLFWMKITYCKTLKCWVDGCKAEIKLSSYS